jgi:2-polyprenyl-3-methyl-5-hydroxy-6-metoxy-1,4-benzoquinol methylase
LLRFSEKDNNAFREHITIMGYKQGETNWYNKFSDQQREQEHRKPWVADGGALLAEAGAILSLLPPPPLDVLDAGCAGGHLSHMLSLAGYRVTGADVCGSVIEAAKTMSVRWNKVDSAATFETMDFDKLPKEKWDVIVFASALHHSIDRRATLASCFGALRKKGLLIASEPGMGHECGQNCKDWARTMDVTEKSTPPFGIAKDGKAVGFRNIKIFPNPITLHKSAYSLDALHNHPFVRFLLSLPFGIAAVGAAKYLHGLTVMQKP